MAMNVNILDSYYLYGLFQGLKPAPTFFRDRYFPTEAGDIYAADKVLVEYQDGDNQMAPFMVERADPITVARPSYEIHDYEPVKLANSRPLRIDDLKKRGFGEAILTDATEAERAAKLIMDDLQALNRRFDRAEEYLCAQTIINNGFSVNEMIDANTIGNTATVQYYDPLGTNDGVYTINAQWAANTSWSVICGDVRTMCRGLANRGLPAQDLLLGQAVADVLLNNSDFKDLLDKNSGIVIASPIVQELSEYVGVSLLGVVNFGGYRLNVIVVDEQYINASNVATNYFPAKSICVTAPGAGHLMYAHITHITDDGTYQTITGKRVPDVFVDRRRKTRELILESRPLAAPKNYSPWVYASSVVA